MDQDRQISQLTASVNELKDQMQSLLNFVTITSELTLGYLHADDEATKNEKINALVSVLQDLLEVGARFLSAQELVTRRNSRI